VLRYAQDPHQLASMQNLFDLLECQKTLLNLFHHTAPWAKVQIFFGDESDPFAVQGFSIVIAPYQSSLARGFVGAVGPLSMDYRRIIPIIDTMAKLIERVPL
jgi:transcriptional regulator of heat shock response